MVYAIADLHGEFAKFKRLLKKIDFSDRDTLYLLGDLVDRGPEPIELLIDLMTYPNIFPLIGNHDAAAAYVLRLLSQEITEDSLENINGKTIALITDWMKDGGATTLKGFRRLSAEDREEVLSYLGEFDLYAEVSAGGKEYVLVHAGLGNFSPDKPLSDYTPDELLFGRTNYNEPLFCGNKYLVTGHTPTSVIPENSKPGYIYRANNHIAIDCGAPFQDGRMGAICLDTGEEFYVE